MDGKKENLIGIVGKENVFNDTVSLESFSHDQSWALPIKPGFIVKPKNVDEVQAVVKWANQTKTPLVPVSSGPPRFYGDTVPSTTGAVIINLSRMNRIIRIDRRNRMTLIEAGVTYSQLQPELAKKDLRVSTPLLPRANKSVVTSLLERQPTLVPKYNWSLPEPLRSLELVWGSGDKMWTGEAGAQPGTLEKQWEMGLAQVSATGPAETDWYRLVSAAQGSMGIITWASVKCEILPKIHRLFFIPGKDISDLIDCAYKLLRLRLGDEFLLLNSTNLAYMLGNGAKKTETLREKLPVWTIIIGVAGRDIMPEEKVDVQVKDIKDITKQFGLQLLSEIPGANDKQVLEILLNPSGDPYWKLRYKGGCQDIFFLTTLDKTPRLIKIVYSLADLLKMPLSDIGIYIQPQHQGVSYQCEFTLPFNPGNKLEADKAKELLTKASEELIKQGAYFSRPYGIWADMVYSRDIQSTQLLKSIKKIFDPNYVLNPGKLCFQLVK